MVLSLTPLQMIVYIIAGILGFTLFMAYFYDRYFSGPKDGVIKTKIVRGHSEIIDKSIPGGRALIESVRPFGNGMVILGLRNSNGFFPKEYHEDEIVPVRMSQVLADTEPPLFMTKDTSYAHTNYAREVNQLMKDKQDAIRQRDEAKQDLAALKASKDSQVDKEVDRIKKSMSPNTPNWGKN